MQVLLVYAMGINGEVLRVVLDWNRAVQERRIEFDFPRRGTQVPVATQVPRPLTPD